MKLVVVGGVAAGASVAARTRRLDEDADIIVLERGHHVSFANCGLPYHIGEVIADRSRLLLQTPQSLRESLDIDVRVGNEVTAIDRKKQTVTVTDLVSGREYTESYDALALCAGAEAMRPPLPGMDAGDQVVVHVSDPGFALDGPAWAKRNGHQLLSIVPEGPGYVATMRKGGELVAAGAVALSPAKLKLAFVVFDGDLDKLIAAFIIANGALAMGEEVSMFFTFWGLNALRKANPPKRERSALDAMFGAMMPRGAEKLTLSQMNMMGAGTAMIKGVMKKNGVQSLPELIAAAQAGGARIIGCTMTMDLLGIAPSDLIDDVELGGVATFLGEAAESTTTLFI